jgi:glycerol-3-phosphate dehydrogenase
MSREWAQTAEDVLWRRSKLGLRVTAEEAARLEAWMVAQGQAPAAVPAVAAAG